jgi:hypothetical protein
MVKTLVLVWNCNSRELLCNGVESVLGFYLYVLKGKNWYWYFIAKIKRDRIGIGILLVYKSPPCPTLSKMFLIVVLKAVVVDCFQYSDFDVFFSMCLLTTHL